MPNITKLYREEHVRAIADAIRDRNESDETYTIAQMDPAIRALESKDHEDIIDENITAIKRDMAAASITCDESSSAIVFDSDDGNNHIIYPTSTAIKIAAELECTREQGAKIFRVSLLSDKMSDMPWNPVDYSDSWEESYPLALDGVKKYGVQLLADTPIETNSTSMNRTFKVISDFESEASGYGGYKNAISTSYLSEPGLLNRNFLIHGLHSDNNAEIKKFFTNKNKFENIIGREVDLSKIYKFSFNSTSYYAEGTPIEDLTGTDIFWYGHDKESDMTDAVVFVEQAVDGIQRLNILWRTDNLYKYGSNPSLMSWIGYDSQDQVFKPAMVTKNIVGTRDWTDTDFKMRYPNGDFTTIYNNQAIRERPTVAGYSCSHPWAWDSNCVVRSNSASASWVYNILSHIYESQTASNPSNCGKLDSFRMPIDADHILYNTTPIFSDNPNYYAKLLRTTGGKELYRLTYKPLIEANCSVEDIKEMFGVGDRESYIYTVASDLTIPKSPETPVSASNSYRAGDLVSEDMIREAGFWPRFDRSNYWFNAETLVEVSHNEAIANFESGLWTKK